MGITANGEHIRTIDLLHAGDVVALNIPDDRKWRNKKYVSPD